MTRACLTALLVAAIARAGHAGDRFALQSSAFAENAAIPPAYTCDGADRSPPLAWSGVPAAAKSLALIVDDPDAPDPSAPRMTWVHWVLYDLPPGTARLPEAYQWLIVPVQNSPQGAMEWQALRLSGTDSLAVRASKKLRSDELLITGLAGTRLKGALEAAMKGHVLAEARLLGTYQRAR